jgi:hypothetical protein
VPGEADIEGMRLVGRHGATLCADSVHSQHTVDFYRRSVYYVKVAVSRHGAGAQGPPARAPELSGGGDRFERVSRRSVLLGAGALAGGAAFGSVLSGTAAGAPAGWPDGHLTSRDARSVDPSQFMPEAQLREWHEELDAMGMRATGYPIHERFIDILMDRLRRVGVRQVHAEPVPFRKWTVGTWALSVGAQRVPTASYIPYSGSTSTAGVTAPLVYVDSTTTPSPGSLAGKIALFDVPVSSVLYSEMELIAYGKYDPHHLINPSAEYSRPWGGVTALITFLDTLPAAGAVGCIGIIDLPPAGAHGSYYPYDGIIRRVPGVFVDHGVGTRLRSEASSGASATVTLTATKEHFVSRNVIGIIPGRTDELVILNSHTDGPNAVEDDGPNTIVAMSQYLTRLPSHALPRTIMVSFTTGHFHGGIGQVTFASKHLTTTLRRTACAVTLEHLGAREWEQDAEGQMALTGTPELGVVFVPENKAMVSAALAALRKAGAGPALALRPYVSTPGSPNGYGWPGEGTQLWTNGHVMTMNYITGPTYLLNWGIPTVRKCNFTRVRREAMAFTEMVLGLSRASRSSLRKLDLPPLSI